MTIFLKTRPEIEDWLKLNDVKNYTLVLDEEYGFIVNASSSVMLINKSLQNIPVKFNVVEGHFICSGNLLEDLDFSPIEVHGVFNCSHNKLINLIGAPKIVKEKFDCSNNFLISLEGAPELIKRGFDCSENNLQSLKYGPKIINGVYNCKNNQLSSFDEDQVKIHGFLFAHENNLSNLDNLPYVEHFINLKCNAKLGGIQNLSEYEEIKQHWLKHKLENNLLSHAKEIKKKKI